MYSSCVTINRMKSNKVLASAEISSSSFYSEVPFENVSSLPIFEVLIEGEKYRFIFDTGGYTVFSDDLTEKLKEIKKVSFIDVKDGNSVVSRINTYVLSELQIGDVLFSNVGFAKIGFTESEWFKCLGLDGTIGPNIMKEAYWQFDNETKLITLTDDKDKLRITRNGFKVPIYTDHVFKPSLELKIGNYTERVGFDTGFNGFLKLVNQPERLVLEKYPSVVRLGNRSNAGNSIIFSDIRIAKIDSVKLRGLVFTDVITAVGDEFSSDLLGSQLFEYYKVMFDLSGGAIYLKEIEEKLSMRDGIESFGFGLDFRKGRVVIDYVYELSKANNMGVKPGQTVLSINGEKLEFSNYCDFIDNFEIPQSDLIEIELLKDDSQYLLRFKKEKIL